MNVIDHGIMYEAIHLGGADGLRSPGKVTLSGHDRTHEWDIRKPMSMGGAATLYRGENIAEFTASFELLRENENGDNEFELWDKFAAMLRGMLPAGGKPKPLPIYHPDLDSQGISVVCLKKLGGMTYDGKGGAVVAVDFLEYRKPKPRIEGPSGPGKLKDYDPNADKKAELAALNAEAARP